ncbi:MAG: translation elongation factor Ts [Bacteroidales bacterium]|jgi:elongation factor Ts|nr:translation elongation factor Ts [Bacteroidales bacterium]MDD3130818.1 translation elongation factor Ts [Bacteroidales bacterium]MDD3526908.1 translation elongation factor Ts [Bacteroidales bacterium]MDD4176903.1 translation elongation factor Ts [Bacteroidales bacterium]NLO52428.1 elongation factor Ts [Bacteroidales bacterium]
MVNITASDVAKLRRQTGAGMMDCKKALQETNGDFEKAIEYLRKKGAKVAAKRADKDATEGYVVALTNSANDFGVMVMVNCETDFVGKSEEFVSFVNGIADAALQHKAETLQETLALKIGDSTVEQKLNDMIGKTGEKMEFDTYAAINAATVAAYNHIGNKIGTLVGLNKNVEGAAEAGHDIAMQIAAMNPVAIDKDFVSDEVIQKELEIGKELARQEGKPEAMLEKISQGRLVKFFKENTLLNQEYIKDSKLSVRDYLQKTDKDLVVTKFYRFALG